MGGRIREFGLSASAQARRATYPAITKARRVWILWLAVDVNGAGLAATPRIALEPIDDLGCWRSPGRRTPKRPPSVRSAPF